MCKLGLGVKYKLTYIHAAPDFDNARQWRSQRGGHRGSRASHIDRIY